MWYTGIFIRLAMTAAMQEFVSPSTRTASGRSASNTSSTLIRVSPSTLPREDVSTSRVVVGSTQAEVFEEDLAQRIVVVLTGVDENVVHRPVQEIDDPR